MANKIFVGMTKDAFSAWLKSHFPYTPIPEPEIPTVAPKGMVLYRLSEDEDWNTEQAQIESQTFRGMEHRNSAVEVILPSQTLDDYPITRIRDMMFKDCVQLLKITISDIGTIGSSAFDGCSNLKELKLLGNIQRLGTAMCMNCTSLQEITLPETVTTLLPGVFYNCSNLSDAYFYPNPENLTWACIKDYEFKTDGSTRIHVKSEYFEAYQTKFSEKVNAIFVGDLT